MNFFISKEFEFGAMILFTLNYKLFFQCSVTCGKGMRYRTVHCAYSDQQMQTEDSCNLEQKPEVEEVCVNDDCLQEKQYTWLTGPWSEVLTFLKLLKLFFV